MEEERTKKIFIRTFGCQMNDYDSERMYRLMERVGWARTEDPAEADLIIVNTCSVRDKPEHKAISELGFLRRHKRNKPDTVLAMAGCVAQQLGPTLFKKISGVDLVIGTHALDKLPQLVEQCRKKRLSETSWDYDALLEFENIAPMTPDGTISWKGTRASGFVPIMRGCDKKCSFCIVPQVRGKEASRPVDDILAEIRALVNSGVRDITLLGQIVNRYGRDTEGKVVFHKLIDAVATIEGIFRLRFASSHPTYITDELVERFARLPLLASHVHLPVQSGSDKILKNMRRGHTIAQFASRVDNLRKARPDISITTDLIVGYPGETEEDFQETLNLISSVQFDSLFAFKYSPRPGTYSSELEETVTEQEKAARLDRIHEIAKPITFRKNRGLEGATKEILVEGNGKGGDEMKFGRTSCNRLIHFSAPKARVGETVFVRIEHGRQNSLTGTLVTS